jgi:hypothetical protein
MSDEAENNEEGNAAAVADAIERPEHVPEKFWDNETKSVKNDDVLKSYNELSGKFGAFTGAPEAYEFALSEQLTEKGINLDGDNPLVAQFTEMAKEANMSQDMANQLVNMFVENQYAESLGFEEAENTRIAEQMKELGDNAEQRINNIKQWATANLNEAERDGLMDATLSAAGVRAVEALIAKSRNAPMVNEDTAQANQISKAELDALQFAKDENGNRKMAVDPEYRKMVHEKYAQAYPGENVITVGQ